MKRLVIGSGFLGVGVAIACLVWHETRASTPSADYCDALSFVPAEASIVLGVNRSEMRVSAWKSVKGPVESLAESALPGIIKGCGFEPLEQVDSAVMAFPKTLRGGSNDFVAVVRGRFDLGRLMECARSSAEKEHEHVTEAKVGTHTVVELGEHGPQVTCVGASTCILASAAWMPKALALVDGTAGSRSVTTDPATVAMLNDTDREGGVWWVGAVPQTFVDEWTADGNPLASLKTTHGSLKLGYGLTGKVAFGLSSDDDARQMATAATTEVSSFAATQDARQMGLGQYLAAPHVAFAATGPEVTIQVAYNPRELDGLERSFKRLVTSATATTPLGAGAERAQALSSTGAPAAP